MKYLTSPSTTLIADEIRRGTHYGQFVGPDSGGIIPGATLGADNGCFPYRDRPDEWPPEPWLQLLDRLPLETKFAVVPDVVFDHRRTLDRFDRYVDEISSRGLFPAFALQDGAKLDEIPFDRIGALFVGGSTTFKYEPIVAETVAEARARGLWTHLGRVNSKGRIRYARSIGFDSVDGNFLRYAPDQNLVRLTRYLDETAAAGDVSLFA